MPLKSQCKIAKRMMKHNPIRPFQSFARSIEMKLCMGHYIHKIIPDAKFEAGSSSSFGDITSQNFLWQNGASHQIRLFNPRKRV